MATTTGDSVHIASPVVGPAALPTLEPGDHLDQPTFHARYEAMPGGIRAELIGGIVFMASPLQFMHGLYHAEVMRWLLAYQEQTPQLVAVDNTTFVLAEDCEPHPDAALLTRPGTGAVRIEGGYLAGSPEFIIEVASSSESYDLHSKKRDYERAGVREYLVVVLRQPQVQWFSLKDGQYVPLAGDADGIFRSEVFPGLWLDAAALLRLDAARVIEVLRQGLGSQPHAEFVQRLAKSSSVQTTTSPP